MSATEAVDPPMTINLIVFARGVGALLRDVPEEERLRATSIGLGLLTGQLITLLGTDAAACEVYALADKLATFLR